MTVSFKFEKLESLASPLYKTQAIDENKNVLMIWQIACEDETQLESIAQEAYELAINAPKKY